MSEEECANRGPRWQVVKTIADNRTTIDCEEAPAVGFRGAVNKVHWEAHHGPNTWPVSVGGGRLVCTPASRAFFEANGTLYALNGHAGACVGKTDGACGDQPVVDVEAIWLPHPSPPKPLKVGDIKIDMGGFITAALKLCGT